MTIVFIKYVQPFSGIFQQNLPWLLVNAQDNPIDGRTCAKSNYLFLASLPRNLECSSARVLSIYFGSSVLRTKTYRIRKTTSLYADFADNGYR